MQKYRPKARTVEAIALFSDNYGPHVKEAIDWIDDYDTARLINGRFELVDDDGYFHNPCRDDYIVERFKGRFYMMKKKDFEASYEKLRES